MTNTRQSNKKTTLNSKTNKHAWEIIKDKLSSPPNSTKRTLVISLDPSIKEIMDINDSSSLITLIQPYFANANVTNLVLDHTSLESKLSTETGKNSSTIVSDNNNIII